MDCVQTVRLNFGTVFEQLGLKFQDCSRIGRTEFSEMFSGVFRLWKVPLVKSLLKQIVFMGHLMCKDILVNFTSYYRCPYRMGLARKVLLESKFVRYSRLESPVYVLWLKR